MQTFSKSDIFKSYQFPIILFSGVAIGCILGIVMGERAMIFKPLGDIFINLMFSIVTPLVFCVISGSIANMMDIRKLGKILKSMFLLFFMTSLIAAVFMLIITVHISPGSGVNISIAEEYTAQTFNVGEQIVKALTVDDFYLLLSRRNMMALIIFSGFFGIATASIGERGKVITQGLDALCEIFLKLIGFLMYYAPIGIGAYFATLVAEYGPELIGAYAKSTLIYYVVTIVYFFVVYFTYAYYSGGITGVKIFYKGVISPAVTALATCSSLATLPSNLEATRKMGVPKELNDIVVPVGTTMHMDGTCLGSILKITFLFGLFGTPFNSIEQYAIAILITLIGSFVMAGVPGGGMMGEILIITMYGFPPEALPIIATIGYLIDPPATMLNATGNTISAMMLTRLTEGKDWITKRGLET